MCYFVLQKQSIMVRQLEEELRMRMRGPSVEMQQQMEVLYNENEHLTREIAILRDTIKVNINVQMLQIIFQCVKPPLTILFTAWRKATPSPLPAREIMEL